MGRTDWDKTTETLDRLTEKQDHDRIYNTPAVIDPQCQSSTKSKHRLSADPPASGLCQSWLRHSFKKWQTGVLFPSDHERKKNCDWLQRNSRCGMAEAGAIGDRGLGEKQARISSRWVWLWESLTMQIPWRNPRGGKISSTQTPVLLATRQPTSTTPRRPAFRGAPDLSASTRRSGTWQPSRRHDRRWHSGVAALRAEEPRGRPLCRWTSSPITLFSRSALLNFLPGGRVPAWRHPLPWHLGSVAARDWVETRERAVVW